MIKVNMLGLFEFYSCEINTQVVIRAKKTKALLVYLLLNENVSFSRVRLADLLWSEFDERRARHNLRQCVLDLKKYLPSNCIISSRDYLELNKNNLKFDVKLFEKYCQSNCIEQMESALKLYKGELMQDFYLDSNQFDFWLDEKRFEVYELMRDTMSQLLTFYIKENNYLKAILLARRILAIDPLNENMHQVLMRLYAQQGRWSEAIKQYRHCRSILFKELNLEPTPRTQQLHDALTAQGHFHFMDNNVEAIENLVV